MKKICVLMLLAMASAFPMVTMAQNKQVKIAQFERSHTSLIASMNQVKDNNGDICAVIRFWNTDPDYVIEPNLGVVKTEQHSGETRLWVPKGTKRITIRHINDRPLRGYSIPVDIESKGDYDADVKLVDIGYEHSENSVYIGAGYNIMSISGPSVSVGAVFNHHNVELGAVYGLNKTNDLYFYNSQGNVSAGYNYNAIRANLRYGYEIPVSDFFSITPQVGIAYNAYIGKEVTTGSSSNYKNANSLSALGALRFTIALSNSFKLCVTPEYNAAVYKDDNCKLISDNDDTFKKWHTGLNLNVGLMIFF